MANSDTPRPPRRNGRESKLRGKAAELIGTLAVPAAETPPRDMRPKKTPKKKSAAHNSSEAIAVKTVSPAPAKQLPLRDTSASTKKKKEKRIKNAAAPTIRNDLSFAAPCLAEAKLSQDESEAEAEAEVGAEAIADASENAIAELLTALGELGNHCSDANAKIKSVVKQLKAGELHTENGISFLEVHRSAPPFFTS